MGMAASQARLLSITSRMSDNELRAQLINNSKMRLTEDSSKASEKYISALNQVELMMSNKDTLGNNMYQQLTYNNLTAYSSYNNQYGLINKSGGLVVSELDAAKYEEAIAAADNNPETDALTEFLKSYGLEKDTTSYYESNGIDDDLKTRYEGDVKYDDNANRISGLHYGYELSKTSSEYMVYNRLLDDYHQADKALTNAISSNMKNYLYGYKPSGESTNYETKYDEVIKYNTDNGKTPTISESQQSLNYINKLFQEMTSSGYINTDAYNENGNKVKSTFYNQMQYYLNEMIVFSGGTASIANSTDITQTSSGYNISEGAFTVTKDSTGNYQVTGSTGFTVNGGVTYNSGEYSFSYTRTETNEDGSTSNTNGICKFSITDPPGAILIEPEDEESTGEAVKDVFKYFQQNVLSQMDRSKFANTAPTQYAAYQAAAKELSIFIFGSDIGAQDYDKLGDIEWVLSSGKTTTNLDGNTYISLKQTENGKDVIKEYLANFEAIKDIYLVEQMIDAYGAPKYTWIDKNNPNENADAKAQWYTNIFEKMQESGYQKIGLELTKSADWIQFALESGLLTMVQVDDEQHWVSTMYSNCSDITEDTIELNVTRAEAEYKRETNKIQAKDKRFDLELKNIDTEHNSLQTEYDSIKSVIDKNVERNFKMFS